MDDMVKITLIIFAGFILILTGAIVFIQVLVV